MLENLIPMVVMTGMFAMIFGIVYIRSRENMAMIEKGLNPRVKDVSPRPFANLKWGLLGIGAGLGLLFAFIIDNTMINHYRPIARNSITIGGHHSGKKHSIVSVSVTPSSAHDTSLALADTGGKNESAAANNNNDDNNEEEHSIAEIRGDGSESAPIYFALIAIGGGLGLFFSYRIEKREWLDKKTIA